MAAFIQPIAPIETWNSHSPASASGGASSASMPFSGILQDAVANMQQTSEVAAQGAYDLALGNTDDLEGIMIDMSKATAAMEFTVQTSSRVVNAYKEIMQMQV